MTSPVVLFDCGLSPLGQKVRLALTIAGIPYRRCEQPLLLPRPDLISLGITHRRIPLLAVGKDVYCDSASAVDALKGLSDTLLASSAEKAYESFGSTIITALLRSFPADAMPGIKADRVTVFPVVGRPDYATLRPGALSELKSLFDIIENEMLDGKSFIEGEAISTADINIVTAVRWALFDLALGQMEGFGSRDLPGIYGWISRIQVAEPSKISAEEVEQTLLGSAYHVKSYTDLSPEYLDIPVGTEAVVESLDAAPGAHRQYGILVGTTRDEVTLEIQNGLRLHFPMRGYSIRRKEVVDALA